LLHHFSKYLKSWVTVCNKTLLNPHLLKTRADVAVVPQFPAPRGTLRLTRLSSIEVYARSR